jgi:hypothetical protein
MWLPESVLSPSERLAKVTHEITRQALQNGSEAAKVELVMVIRCKNCRHWVDAHDDGCTYCMRMIPSEDYRENGYMYPLEVVTHPDDFCSYAELK